jgi:hypothetical protein
MTPLEIIALRAPEIAEANASRLPGLIDLASQSVGEVFGARRSGAIALKVLCQIANDGVSSGAATRGGATKVKEGDVELGFAAGSGSVDQGNPAGVSWCAEFRSLARSCGAGLPRNRMV